MPNNDNRREPYKEVRQYSKVLNMEVVKELDSGKLSVKEKMEFWFGILVAPCFFQGLCRACNNNYAEQIFGKVFIQRTPSTHFRTGSKRVRQELEGKHSDLPRLSLRTAGIGDMPIRWRSTKELSAQPSWGEIAAYSETAFGAVCWKLNGSCFYSTRVSVE